MNYYSKSTRQELRRRLALFIMTLVAAWLFVGATSLNHVWAAPPADGAKKVQPEGNPDGLPVAQKANGKDAAKDKKKQPKNFWELVVSGGPVMIPLALFSIIGFASSVERFISLSRDRALPAGFLEGLKQKLKGVAGIKKGITYCEEQGRETPLGPIMKAGLEKAGRGSDQVEKAVEDMGIREADRMKRSLRLIGLVVAIAPLLGLVGTVYGMIEAFRDLATLPPGESKSDVLADGIYVALVTTAAGLTIAIPFLAVYHLLSAKIDGLIDGINTQADLFLEICPTSGTAAAKKKPASRKNPKTAEASPRDNPDPPTDGTKPAESAMAS